jgi:hypothetical protein
MPVVVAEEVLWWWLSVGGMVQILRAQQHINTNV